MWNTVWSVPSSMRPVSIQQTFCLFVFLCGISTSFHLWHHPLKLRPNQRSRVFLLPPSDCSSASLFECSSSSSNCVSCVRRRVFPPAYKNSFDSSTLWCSYLFWCSWNVAGSLCARLTVYFGLLWMFKHIPVPSHCLPFPSASSVYLS